MEVSKVQRESGKVKSWRRAGPEHTQARIAEAEAEGQVLRRTSRKFWAKVLEQRLLCWLMCWWLGRMEGASGRADNN